MGGETHWRKLPCQALELVNHVAFLKADKQLQKVVLYNVLVIDLIRLQPKNDHFLSNIIFSLPFHVFFPLKFSLSSYIMFFTQLPCKKTFILLRQQLDKLLHNACFIKQQFDPLFFAGQIIYTHRDQFIILPLL